MHVCGQRLGLKPYHWSRMASAAIEEYCICLFRVYGPLRGLPGEYEQEDSRVRFLSASDAGGMLHACSFDYGPVRTSQSLSGWRFSARTAKGIRTPVAALEDSNPVVPSQMSTCKQIAADCRYRLVPVIDYACRLGLYWIASAKCAVSIPSLPAKSAIVRASFRMR